MPEPSPCACSTAFDQSGVTLSSSGRILNSCVPATKVTGTCESFAPLCSSFVRADAASRPPTSTPAIVVPAAIVPGEPEKRNPTATTAATTIATAAATRKWPSRTAGAVRRTRAGGVEARTLKAANPIGRAGGYGEILVRTLLFARGGCLFWRLDPGSRGGSRRATAAAPDTTQPKATKRSAPSTPGGVVSWKIATPARSGGRSS